MIAQMDSTAPQEGSSLYRRLVWLTLLRIVLVTLLLAASAVVVVRAEVSEDSVRVEQTLYAVIVGTYLASLGYLLVLRRSPKWHTLLAYAQVTGDVLIAGCLVYLTGGAESVIVFMFPLNVVSAAVLLYRPGAIYASVLSAAGVTLVVTGLNAGWLPPAAKNLAQAQLAPERLAFILFAHVSAIFLTGSLASYLAEQLRRTGERLTARELDYEALALLHENIVRSISSGLCSADRFGRITFLNRAAEEITGYSLANVRGDPLEQRFPAIKRYLHGDGPTSRLEVEHVTPTGEQRRLGLAISPLVDGDGSRQGFVLTFQDLTSIRAMEEAVKRSERLAAVGAMAAGLAHELRNPLASMSGSIQLLASGKTFSDDEQQLMRIVLREADRLNGLITDFLQFARPSPPQLEPMELGALLGETLALFRNDPAREEVEVEEQIAGPLWIDGDSHKLRQVAWNLLTNAAESMAGAGTVRVEASRVGGEIRVRFIDTGEGVEPDQLPNIFDPFFTTKERGTGLGLATVHGVIDGHGGRIDVTSERGKGSTFTIVLPAIEAPARAAAV